MCSLCQGPLEWPRLSSRVTEAGPAAPVRAGSVSALGGAAPALAAVPSSVGTGLLPCLVTVAVSTPETGGTVPLWGCS